MFFVFAESFIVIERYHHCHITHERTSWITGNTNVCPTVYSGLQQRNTKALYCCPFVRELPFTNRFGKRFHRAAFKGSGVLSSPKRVGGQTSPLRALTTVIFSDHFQTWQGHVGSISDELVYGGSASSNMRITDQFWQSWAHFYSHQIWYKCWAKYIDWCKFQVL